MKPSLLSVLFLLLFSQIAQAQNASDDFMRSIGKINVVVAVVVVVFIGIVLFLAFMDKRLTNLENQIKNHGK